MNEKRKDLLSVPTMVRLHRHRKTINKGANYLLRQQSIKCKNNFFLEELPSNSMDTEEENFSLFNTDLFVPRIIAKLPKIYKSVIGAQVQFSCVTTVLFPVECEWFLNGEFLDPLESDGRFYYKDNRKTLVILSLRGEDNGELAMVARNKFGKSKTKCNLTVLDTDFNVGNTNKEPNNTKKTKNGKTSTRSHNKKQTLLEELLRTSDGNSLSVQETKSTNRNNYSNNKELIRVVETGEGNRWIDTDLCVSHNTIQQDNKKECNNTNNNTKESILLNKVVHSTNTTLISHHLQLQKKSSNTWYNETSTLRLIDPLRQKMTLSDF